MLRLVEIMLAESDNIVAEALARQVALARNQPASYAGAAAAVDAALAELGLPAQESALADGSGLSRTNRLTASALTEILTYAAGGQRPELAGLLTGLPVAGWSGTLADRFQAKSGTGKAGIGAVRAKTGTLSGVHAMAGVVVTAEGRMLAFALLADGVTANHWDAQATLDAIAARLASCGC
jgi:D-alanyl-D-alanine carboxypeptidase/D-alanyl-D-alanine-endopeptidase (penicillin-binding protein 4)